MPRFIFNRLLDVLTDMFAIEMCAFSWSIYIVSTSGLLKMSLLSFDKSERSLAIDGVLVPDDEEGRVSSVVFVEILESTVRWNWYV